MVIMSVKPSDGDVISDIFIGNAENVLKREAILDLLKMPTNTS